MDVRKGKLNQRKGKAKRHGRQSRCRLLLEAVLSWYSFTVSKEQVGVLMETRHCERTKMQSRCKLSLQAVLSWWSFAVLKEQVGVLERTRAMLEDEKAKQTHALLRSNEIVSELDAYSVESAHARVCEKAALYA